jgi:hypothetical protein
LYSYNGRSSGGRHQKQENDLLPLEIGLAAGLLLTGLIADIKELGAIVFCVTAITIVARKICKTRYSKGNMKAVLQSARILLSATACFIYTKKEIEPGALALWLAIFFAAWGISERKKGDNARIKKGQMLAPVMMITGVSLSFGHTFEGSYMGAISSFIAAPIFGYLSNSNSISYLKGRCKATYFAPKALYSLMFALLTITAWRQDFFDNVDGSAFHWQYFVGPAYESINGLWGVAANQYGWAPIFSASLIGKTPWQGLYIFQSILYTVTLGCFYLIGMCKDKPRRRSLITLVGLGFLLLFADPSSIGPQAFPSSGLIRFFPAYCILGSGLLCELEQKRSKGNGDIGIKTIWIASVGLMMIWSGESLLMVTVAAITSLSIKLLELMRQTVSLIYEITISRMGKITDIVNTQELKGKAKSYTVRFFTCLIQIGGCVLLIYTADKLSLFSAGKAYTLSKHGWTYPDGWITLVPVFTLASICATLLMTKCSNQVKIAYISCFGWILGYVAYRPVSNNTTAVLPLLACLLVGLQLIKRYPFNSIKSLSLALIAATISTSFSIQLLAATGTRFNLIEKLKTRKDHKVTNKNVLLNQVGCEDVKDLIRVIHLKVDRTSTLPVSENSLGIVEISPNGFFEELVGCDKNNEGAIFVLRPMQLYLEPMQAEEARKIIQLIRKKRKLDSLILLTEVHPVSEMFRRGLIARIGSSFAPKNHGRIKIGEKDVELTSIRLDKYE